MTFGLLLVNLCVSQVPPHPLQLLQTGSPASASTQVCGLDNMVLGSFVAAAVEHSRYGRMSVGWCPLAPLQPEAGRSSRPLCIQQPEQSWWWQSSEMGLDFVYLTTVSTDAHHLEMEDATLP